MMRNYNMIVKAAFETAATKECPNSSTTRIVLQCPTCGGIEVVGYGVERIPVQNCQNCCPESLKRKD